MPYMMDVCSGRSGNVNPNAHERWSSERKTRPNTPQGDTVKSADQLQKEAFVYATGMLRGSCAALEGISGGEDDRDLDMIAFSGLGPGQLT